MCGFGAPYVVGILAPNQTLSEWRLVFWMICCICILTNLVFVLYASGEVQEWNNPDFERKKKTDELEKSKEHANLLIPEKVQIFAIE